MVFTASPVTDLVAVLPALPPVPVELPELGLGTTAAGGLLVDAAPLWDLNESNMTRLAIVLNTARLMRRMAMPFCSTAWRKCRPYSF